MKNFIKHIGVTLLMIPFSTFIGNSQTIFWENEFETPSEWTQSFGPSHMAGDWQFLTAIPSIIAADQGIMQWPAAFSAASNNFIFINYAGPADAQDAYLEYNTDIDLAILGSTPFEITFNDYYRKYLEQTFVEVSNDGGNTWVAFEVNSDVPTNTNCVDGEMESILVSPFAGAWSNQVRIRFHYLGNYDWFWGVDNLKIISLPAYNLVLNNISWGSTGTYGTKIPYYQIPVSQITPIEISGSVTNAGTQNQNDVVLNVNATSFTGNSIATTINSAATETLICQPFTPAGLGTYNIFEANVSSPNSEEIPANNTIPNIATIEVTDFVYAIDDGLINTNFQGYSSAAYTEVGNVFDIFSNVFLDAIDVVPASGAGEAIVAKLYRYDQGNLTFIDESLPYVLDPADLGTSISLPLLTTQFLGAGEVYLAMAVFSSPNVDVAYSAQNEFATSFVGDGSSFFIASSTPIVRMRFSSCSANISYQTIDSTFCELYTSPSGQIYTQSGTYQDTLQNVNGCDSLITTMNLTLSGEYFIETSFQVSPSNCSSPTGSITASFVGTPILGNSIFISEYYVGNSSDYVLEIYNSTNADFDISAVQLYDYFGNLIPYNFQLQNTSNQLFSFPPNTVIPALGTILISNPNSSISASLSSSVIDGSAISIIGNAGPIVGIQVFDIVEPALNQTQIRNGAIVNPNPTFNLGEWYSLPLSSESLGAHNHLNNYQIQWSNGVINNTLSNISEGNYSFSVVDSVSGCILETGVVTVPNVSNNFNPTFSSANQLYTAPPFAVQFTNSTANAANYSFTWDFGDGATLASNNASVFHQYSFNGQYTVSLIATDNITGCTDTTTLSDYIFCTGGVSCTHAATISQASPLQSCQDTPVWLTCNNDSSFTYQWRKNGVTISGNNNDSLAVTQSGTYSVTILVDNCPVNSNDVVVNILSTPTTPIISSSGVIQSCIGGSVTLNTGSYATYNWSTGASTQSINVSNSGIYSVSATAANGCSAVSAPFNLNASFVAPPQVCIVGMDSLTNENRIIWEKPLTSGIDSFYVYKESIVSNVYTKIGATDFNDLAVFLDVNSNPAVQAYRYKISALDTCGTESNVGDFHKTIHLTINQGVGNSWNLIWSHYEGLTFGSYKIYRGTSLSNIALLTTIQSNLNSYTDLTPPTGPVYYQIEVVNPNNCDPTKVLNYSVSRSNIVNNGINAISEEILSTVNVYPNPTNDNFTINVSNDLLGKNYQIADFAGRVIAQGKINSLIQIVDMQGVSNGSYLLQIDQPTVRVIKIVKQ